MWGKLELSQDILMFTLISEILESYVTMEYSYQCVDGESEPCGYIIFTINQW